MLPFEPFKEEAAAVTLDQLTVENRLDRIALYGSLQITRDQAGLRLARELKTLLDAAVATLEQEELPDRLTERDTERIRNPFR